ncbi:vWA domain-containing protein [Leptospira ognonensis]|uniref:vWA domain-containing protein n=1 Tax=Leptospira ognonensis TaxID=2484945 RepID=UPI001FEC9D4B|nr:VWA domain-containing protein [Leptospira ognonensis]
MSLRILISKISFFFSLSFLLVFNLYSESVTSNKRYVFIVDASGSMAEKIDGVTRMAIAKDQLMNFLSKLPKDSEVGLVAYGNRIAGCSSARLYQPIQKGGASAAITKLTSIIPSGSTPIAHTLELVGEYLLRDYKETEIIFISDGMESCEGDPAMTLHALKTRGKKFNLHILGIDLDPKAEEDLTALAKIGNGKYFTVKKREDMEYALLNLGGNLFISDTQASSPKKPYIKILSILPYSQTKGNESYIIHYEFEGITNQGNQLVQMNLFPREKSVQTKEVPPLREKRLGDLSQTEVQFQPDWRGKGKLVLNLNQNQESETSLELWSLESVPRILAKSDIKLLQNFSP